MDSVPAVHEAELEQRLEALESARSWSPRVVSRLESRVRSGDDLSLFRINPKAYASETSMSAPEAVDLFLHAAHVGLFRMEWNLVCASCGNTAQSFRGLAKVDPHFVCELCQMVNDPSLDEYIQVNFTIAPAVRAISYHAPEDLSAEDRFYNFHMSRDVRPDSGTENSLRALRASTHHLAYLPAGETATIDFDFTGAAVAIRDSFHAASVIYFEDPEKPEPVGEPTAVRLAMRDGQLSDRDRTLEPFEFMLTKRAVMRLLFPGVSAIPSGPVSIAVENAMDERALIWVVERLEIPTVFDPIEFEPILCAKEALSTQTFRTLFRSETVAASESLAIRDLTFLFTDLRDSTAMYERIGDASAYNLVRLHFDALEVVIREHGGAIVKTIGDAIMATFVEPGAGVRAAMQMSDRLREFNRSSSADLSLKMGLHRGHAIAVTSNESVDYFGQTVNIAARIQAMAGASELCLSEDIYRGEGVAGLLDGASVEPEAGIMKGVTDEIALYRVALD